MQKKYLENKIIRGSKNDCNLLPQSLIFIIFLIFFELRSQPAKLHS